MSEKRWWIVEKYHEPEPEVKATLTELSEPDNYELIGTTDGIGYPVESRYMTAEEAEMVNARTHIYLVSEDEPVYADTEEPVSEDARRATLADVARKHGFDKAHAAGYRGQGRRIGVIDTGLSRYHADRLGSRIKHKRSYVQGEDWTDTKSGHGTHVMGTIATLAPDAELCVYKNLSTLNGSGSSSGGVNALNQAGRDGCTDVNCSWGGNGSPTSPSSRAVDALRAKGIRVSIASGNAQRGTTAMTSEGRAPASAARGWAIACQDIDNRLSAFSSWGRNVKVRTTGEAQLSWGLNATQVAKSGTSMACPVGCAGGAVCGSYGAPADSIDTAILSTCGDTPLPAYKEGAGIMDVEFAIRKLPKPAPKEPAPSPGAPAPTPEPEPSPAPAPEPEQPKRLYRFSVTETGQILALSDPAGVKRAREDLDRLGVKYRVEEG